MKQNRSITDTQMSPASQPSAAFGLLVEALRYRA
jgi:hypothetical protein